jgi:hypothetical protein
MNAQNIYFQLLNKVLAYFSLNISIEVYENDVMKPCGRLFKVDEQEYQLEIRTEYRSAKDIVETIIHEVVHIWQYETKKLKLDLTIPYTERWWEIEAFKMQKQLSEYFYDMYCRLSAR